jgi:hypothetical protein
VEKMQKENEKAASKPSEPAPENKTFEIEMKHSKSFTSVDQEQPQTDETNNPLATSNAGNATSALREELSALKNSELRKWAKAAGTDEKDIAKAEDADGPNEALVELIVQKGALYLPAALRAGLSRLKVSDLKSLAREAGVDAAALDAADDAGVPKDAISALILEAAAEAAAAGVEARDPQAALREASTSYLEWFDVVKGDDVLKKMWRFDDPSSRLPRCFGRAPSDDEINEQEMIQRRRFGKALVDTVSVICEEFIVRATAGQGAAWVMTPANRTSCMQLLGDGLAKCDRPKYTWIGEIKCDSGIVRDTVRASLKKDEDGVEEYGGIIRQLRMRAAVVDETAKKPPHVIAHVVYPDQSAFFPSGVGPVCCHKSSLLVGSTLLALF